MNSQPRTPAHLAWASVGRFVLFWLVCFFLIFRTATVAERVVFSTLAAGIFEAALQFITGRSR